MADLQTNRVVLTECMKSVLFIVSNLESGGVSKSIVSLLNTIDRQRYNISLLVLNPAGLFMELLPSDIRVITNLDMVALSMKGAGVWALLRRGRISLALGHIVRMGLSCVNRAWAGWWLSRLMPALEDNFDVAVDYNGQHQLYYMVDKVRAKRKITFFHSDYDKWDYYRLMDTRYFPKVDNIFTVSQYCVDSLKRNFPQAADRVACMENISNAALIRSMSELEVDDMVADVPIILTIGHICRGKGADMAIRAASILKREGVQFKWYFLGQNSLDMDYESLIERCRVQDRVCFLGLRANPYPYLKRSTIYVHPSLFEGRSIALDEAKLLCKPIVVTNFSTVKDQFQDRVNGSICEMSPESVAESVAELLANEPLRQSYTKYLQSHCIDNCSEVDKLCKLFDVTE